MQVDRSLYWGILDHFLFCIYQSLFILDIVKNKLSLKELTESNLSYNHLLDILQFVKDINLIFQAEIDLVNNNNQKFWNKVWETVFKREYTKGTTNKFFESFASLSWQERLFSAKFCDYLRENFDDISHETFKFPFIPQAKKLIKVIRLPGHQWNYLLKKGMDDINVTMIGLNNLNSGSFKRIKKLLMRQKNYTQLEISFSLLNQEQLEQIFKIVKDNLVERKKNSEKLLEKLILRSLKLSKNNLILIAEIVKMSTGLVELVIETVDSAKDLEFSYLFTSGDLLFHPSLTLLTVSDCAVGELSIEKFIHDHIRERNLEILGLPEKKNYNFHGCLINHHSVKRISNLLSSSFPLIELNLNDNLVSDFGAFYLAEGLSSVNCKLKSLKLSRCQIERSGGVLLLDCLRFNKSLQSIDLSVNDIGINLILPEILSINKTLTSLNLSQTQLSYISEDLKNALIKNTSLTELFLSGNRLQASGLLSFLEILKANFALSYLDLSSNGIPFNDLKSCIELLDYRKEQLNQPDKLVINLQRNPIDTQILGEITDQLRKVLLIDHVYRKEIFDGLQEY